jgi:hypothetical protein
MLPDVFARPVFGTPILVWRNGAMEGCDPGSFRRSGRWIPGSEIPMMKTKNKILWFNLIVGVVCNRTQLYHFWGAGNLLYVQRIFVITAWQQQR